MRRKTLLNRNVIIVLMLFIFLMTAFVSTAYSLWYFPNSGNPKTVNANIYHDDIEENFKKDTSNYLKIIDCRDGKIPNYTDFAMQGESGFLDNSINFTDNGNTFRGKKGEDGKYRYSKKVFSVPSLNLRSFVFSVSYRLGTSIPSSGTSATDMTEIYLYDLLNSKYKLVDHLTNESIELIDRNGTSSDGGNMDKPLLDVKLYSSTKSEAYREKIGCSFSKSRILFLVPRDTETPTVSDYNIYFHNEDPNDKKGYNKLGYVWLWNDRTDFGASLPLSSETKDGKNYKSLHIKYNALYEACNDFKEKNKKAGFIMTPQTAPTGIIFKTEDGTNFAPKDNNGNIEYLALPLPPNNSTFDIYITADQDNGKFTIKTNQDVDLTKNKNIVFYSVSGLDHLWMWSKSEDDAQRKVGRWISSNYVYKFNMADCNKTISCFSYNYGEKFNFYKNWKGPTPNAGTSAEFSPGFTFDKNEAGEKIDYNYDRLILADYDGASQTGKDKDKDKDISELFNGTSECTSVYLIVNDKNEVTKCTTSKDDFIKELNKLN